MKISGGLTEQGIVVGNAYDKYGSRNPIVRRLMKGFEDTLTSLVSKAAPETIHEIGCGEGYWVIRWNQNGFAARGCDFSEQAISLARDNATNAGISPTTFAARNIYDVKPGEDSADLIVCCEVLEHLDDPKEGIAALERIASSYIILSVPREPIWCFLNLARGKYIRDFGNTPGHIQHWSTGSFVAFVRQHFDILDVRTPLPWTMLLCQKKT